MCVPKVQGRMGFRDIHCFNLALLAKQAWRLLDNPESFCATILRAKYYPDGDLLNSKPKHGASFTWQSIMADITTLKRGYIWRVGNEHNINIWEDAWIPNCATRKIVTPKGGQLLSKVVDLIDPISNNWNEDLNRQAMWPIDAQRILSIPISQHNMTDFIARSYTKNGTFSVRSAYSAEWNYQYGSQLKHSNGMGRTTPNPIWCQIWKLSCPGKVNFFIWRTLHGTLPCRATLANRHMKVWPLCPTCSQGVEDTKHMLFLCTKAKEVWKRLGMDDIIDRACEVDRAREAILNTFYFFQSKICILWGTKMYEK
ncbi:unnamed protein product [Triticum aestivum]|uniref:Reverse transcriptase zinc-binding domain-containing protein n=1 Tax=Triticum aestivum TaxID=4565 RepID=A0A7H4LDM8_WHEAT|nr:unnamed protein product [Triticum aestivum]